MWTILEFYGRQSNHQRHDCFALSPADPVMGHKIYGLFHAMLGALILYILTGLYEESWGLTATPRAPGKDSYHEEPQSHLMPENTNHTDLETSRSATRTEALHCPDQEHELKHSLEISRVSFFIGCFTQVSLEFPSREGRCSQCWNHVSISICHESFGINHKTGFFVFPWKYPVFPLWDCLTTSGWLDHQEKWKQDAQSSTKHR